MPNINELSIENKNLQYTVNSNNKCYTCALYSITCIIILKLHRVTSNLKCFCCREKLSSDERFVDELRNIFRFIFAIIFRRLKKVRLNDFYQISQNQ